MKILVCHNFYQQPGGEDTVFRGELDLLAAAGHDARAFTRHNDEIRAPGAPGRLTLALRTLHSADTVRRLEELTRDWRPDLVSAHNLHPLLSPSVLTHFHRLGVPVVQHLHNYRWLCAGGTLFRDGAVCRDCLDRPGGRLHALAHRCYRGSLSATATLALTQSLHAGPLRTYHRAVAGYGVLTAFMADLFAAQGFDRARMRVLPNFLDDPLPPAAPAEPGDGFFFAGRLDDTKGADLVVAAARALPGHPFRLAGAGPAEPALRAAAQDLPNVHWLGRLDRPTLLAGMRASRAVLIPSRWLECFPLTLLEGFSSGRPVVVPAASSPASLLRDGVDGLTFPSGDDAGLVSVLRGLLDNPARADAIGRAGRVRLETEFTRATAGQRKLDWYAELAAAAR